MGLDPLLALYSSIIKSTKHVFAIKRISPHNEMCKSTHEVVDYLEKQCSGMLGMRSFHMTQQHATWGGCILLFI